MAYSDYEIETNPELQRTEINPTVKNVMCKHDVIYKTLATVGDFYCRIWYYNDNYDPSRTTEGTKRIHIVPTEESFITEHLEINEWLNLANDYWSEGVVFVNPIIRRNGVNFNVNADLKDCVKYMSGVASHYEADKDKIIAIDLEDNQAMYDMNYDLTSSKVFSDVSNDNYSDFTSGPVGNGSLSISKTTEFATGSIAMSQINSKYVSGNNLGSYYRGQGVANISDNNNVPTSGAISFGDLRNSVSKITADCNGNWMHCQARYEVFGNSEWTSTVNKQINLNGNFGGNSDLSPAVRFHSGGNGQITAYVTSASGNPRVRGYSGEGGGGGGNNGKAGGRAMVVSSPIFMPNNHKDSRVRGAGGGGGGGGNGGKGGGGGHSGGRRCSGWFCNSSYRVCSNNGGAGGNGGSGGQGGRGAGYYWNGNNAFIDVQTASSRNGSGGSGGSGGSSRGGGTGGTGGNGRQGGAFESNGSGGSQGGTGGQGAGDQEGCGYHSSGRNGKAGQGGGGAGGNNGKILLGGGGSISNI